MSLSDMKLTSSDFQLPSRGIGYKSGVLRDGITDGVISVSPMSARLEILAGTVDMLVNGKFFAEVCRECIPDILQPEGILHGDVYALMTFLRSITLGSSFEFDYQHGCQLRVNGNTKWRYVPVSDAPPDGEPIPDDHMVIEVMEGKTPVRKLAVKEAIVAPAHTYSVNLDTHLATNTTYLDAEAFNLHRSLRLETGHTVQLHPITQPQQVDILLGFSGIDSNVSDPTIVINRIFNTEIEMVLASIENIDGVDDKDELRRFLVKLPRRVLSQVVAHTGLVNNFGCSSSTKLKCKNCGEEVSIQLPTDPISFFSMR